MGRKGERERPLPSIMAGSGGASAPRRPCPTCSAAMTPCFLAGVAIDQCDAHGLWFDHDELERVLLSRAPKRATSDVSAVEAAGGVLEGLGDLLTVLDIFT